MSHGFLEFSRLTKRWPAPGGATVAVRDFDLGVAEGEFVCLIGHSGCGKSTVLSIAMGLTEPSEGGVILAGREVSGPGIDRGVVFQAPTLLPWLTVAGNVRLAVDRAQPDASRPKRRELTEYWLALVGLGDLGNRLPHELSAGMQQRVGIARAFALEPRVLLLDEPFSLLDAITRMELQDELLRLWERDRRTVLMVTHDVDEALLLADRIVMMTPGPGGTIGGVMGVPFARPRLRDALLDDPDFYAARDALIGFLEGGPAEVAREESDDQPWLGPELGSPEWEVA